jgi:hypothetical protein
MFQKLCIHATFMIFAVFGCVGVLFGQTPAGNLKIPWRLTVVIMDGTDPVQQAQIPVTEAVAFIEKHSRFVFEVEYITSKSPHGYTPYRFGPDKNRDGKGDSVAYSMMGWNLPGSLVRSLPVSSSYLFLYKMKGRRPATAGSALGLDFGLRKGGKPRPYATVPTDMHWFINVPNQGFKSWAAQILAHEIINTIQAKVEAAPFRCGQLKGKPGAHADIHEFERLKGLNDRCYSKLGRNAL